MVNKTLNRSRLQHQTQIIQYSLLTSLQRLTIMNKPDNVKLDFQNLIVKQN